MDRFQSVVDAQIEAARRRGDFDRLPGHGEPLKNLDQHDRDWWIKQKMAEEAFEGFPATPSLGIRKRVRDTLEQLKAIDDPALLRSLLDDLNREIREVNRLQTKGPSSNVLPIDVQRYLRERDLG